MPIISHVRSVPRAQDSIPDRTARSSVAISTELPDQHIQELLRAYLSRAADKIDPS